MLPRFASLDREFNAACRSYVRAASRSSPVLREIRRHVTRLERNGSKLSP